MFYELALLEELPLREHLSGFIQDEVIDFIFKYAEHDDEKSHFVETASQFNIMTLRKNDYESLVNLKPVNDIRYINKFFHAINGKLASGGIYIGRFESVQQRFRRITHRFPKIFSYPYYFADFILHRVFPRLPYFKKVYFYLTKGIDRAMPLAEVLGRLVSSGFEIIEYRNIQYLVYFVAKKVGEPKADINPSYGPLFKMRRVGKGGKLIDVYKFRTMHPYSEFLQKFIFEKNKLEEGGKIKNDFRVTTWGRVFRKLWIDELPMIVNMLKGELKLVGVRPLSQHYLSLYPEEFRERRKNYTPGLVPPFYVDLPKTFDEIIESERRYLDAYDKHKVLADIKYFFLAFYNIFIKGARSA
ncbi:MAG: sugar transferase [Ignavibacteriales bacterium]|nr:sugar transferase [Ignavibacteriales bacterium]